MAAPLWGLALFPLMPLGSWDLALCGLELAFGLAVALRSPRPRRVFALTALVLACSAAAIEVLALALPEPPTFPPPQAAHFLFIPSRMSSVQAALYGDARHALINAADLAADTRPRVLHLGDSMIFGEGVDRALTTTVWLDRFRPDVTNLNLGVSGSGPDVHLLLLRRWVDVVKPSLVVHHLFVGNDIDDIDVDYGACDGAPLLEYRPDGPVARCPQPRWHVTFRDRLRLSPPPYPLRVATAFSRAARHLCASLGRLGGIMQSRVDPRVGSDDQSQTVQWAHFERILAAERDELDRRGIELVCSVLPWREALEDAAPRSTRAWRVRERMLKILETLHITALDPWPLFESCVDDGSGAGCFIDPPPRDFHLGARGHQRYAEWLHAKLSPGSGAAAIARARPSQVNDVAIPQAREEVVRALFRQYWGRPTPEFSIDQATIEKTVVRLAVRARDTAAELFLRRPHDDSQSRPTDRVVRDPQVPLAVGIRCSACDDQQRSVLESVARQVLENQASRPDGLWETVTADGTPQY